MNFMKPPCVSVNPNPIKRPGPSGPSLHRWKWLRPMLQLKAWINRQRLVDWEPVKA